MSAVPLKFDDLGIDVLLAGTQKAFAMPPGAAVFAYPSLYEGFGLPVIEAMAMGCPVLTSNRSSLPETLQDGGEYFNPQDSTTIAEAINRLIQDPEKRARVAARAKELAAQYSWARCAQETWQFIVQTYRAQSLKAVA